ncbi:MAG: glycosyltransferase family 4 protein [Firmicutes bacterium]|nr:glycosyltransferase family 4 protein [Bacillota bacterium]
MANIIFILNSPYPYYTGGRETWIYNVCNRLADKHNISIITEKKYYADNRDGVFEGIHPSIKIYPVFTLKNISWLRPFIRWYAGFLNNCVSLWLMKRELKKIIGKNEKIKYYVISMDTLFTGSVAAWSKKQFDNVLYVSSVRSTHAEISGKRWPLLKKKLLVMERKNLMQADDIWANGNDTRDNLKEKGFNSRVVRNGVNIKQINHPDIGDLHDVIYSKEPKIVTIGTLLDIKGYQELIRAVGLLHKRFKLKVHLIAIGKGDPQRYGQLAKSEDVVEYVHFLGEQRNAAAYAKNADVIACLSGGSGLSMAALESLATKKPVIAWDSPVYRQMIEHMGNGFLVEEKNVEQLARGIAFILQNKDRVQHLGENAYLFARQYDWGYVVKDVETSLLELAGT